MIERGPAAGERLQKVLARAGVGSRRRCDELVAAGRVAVNGEVAELGRRVRVPDDRVTVDGVPVVTDGSLVHYLLNKPTGVISTARDERGRPKVTDLVPAEPRVFPVGRLDASSEGLMVVTNDGELAHILTHPRHGVDKVYLTEVEGIPRAAALEALRRGVELPDGVTAPARVKLLQRRSDTAALEIVIHEGRNRQVRRMCEAVGHPVVRLVRTRIGPLSDRTLPPGGWRHLRPDEVRSLYACALGLPFASSGPGPGQASG